MTSSPKSLNLTVSLMSLWVPTTISIEPSSKPIMAALISLGERKRLISAIFTGHLAKRSVKV